MMDLSQLNLSVDLGKLFPFLEGLMTRIGDLEKKNEELQGLLSLMKEAEVVWKSEVSEKLAVCTNRLNENDGKFMDLSLKTSLFEKVDPQHLFDKVGVFDGKLGSLVERLDISEVNFKNIDKGLSESRLQLSLLDKKTSDNIDDVRNIQVEVKKHDVSLTSICERLLSQEQLSAESSKQIDAIEDSFTLRYDAIRNEVMSSLRRVAEEQAKFLHQQESSFLPQDKYFSECSNLVKGLVGSAQKAIATAKFDVVRKKALENMVIAWNIQSGLATKRLMASRCLCRIFKKSINKSYQTWKWFVKSSFIITSISVDLEKKIPDVPKFLLSTGIEDKIKVLEEGAGKVCTSEKLDKAKEDLLGMVENKSLKIAELIDIKISDGLKTRDSRTDELEKFLSLISAKVGEINTELSESKNSLVSDYATSKDLQKLMTDVLLLWNSLKQIDLTKSDKKELEQVTNEISNKVALAVSASSQTNKQLGGSKFNTNENDFAEDVYKSISEHDEKIADLHKMLADLSEFVDELVLRFSALSNKNSSSSMPLPRTSVSAALRTGGGFKPHWTAAIESEENLQQPPSENMERFLKYARNIVSQAADFATRRAGPNQGRSQSAVRHSVSPTRMFGKRELLLETDDSSTMRVDGGSMRQNSAFNRFLTR